MKMEKTKFWFWTLLDALIAVLIVNVVFFVMPTLGKLGDSFAPVHTLTVTAQGKTAATPDLAIIDFSVVTQGQSPSALSDSNNGKMNAVLQFVQSEGIATSDIKTTAYDLEPNYQWDHNTQRNYITGYTLTQTVEVKVRDISKVASVLAGLAPLGVNQIGNVEFTFADENAVLAAARADAFSQALAKAQSMAADAHVSLGRVVNVAENTYIPGPRPVYAAMSAPSLGMASPVVPNIQPGTQDITDDVTIVYELQ